MLTVAIWAQLYPVPNWVKPSFVIFDIRALWHAGLSVLTWSGTGCFIAVAIWQQWASKG